MNDIFSRLTSEVDKIHPSLGSLLDEGLSYVPYLNNFLISRKINRLHERLEENREQIRRIGQLYSDCILSNEYINERIFPIVLGDLIEEHESAKITLILNGFENVFINEHTNESLLINYYDSLRNLRYADVKRLLHLYHKEDANEYSFEENSDEYALIRNIDVKLERLGFFHRKTPGLIFKPINEGERKINSNSVIFSSYCEKFIKFISVE